MEVISARPGNSTSQLIFNPPTQTPDKWISGLVIKVIVTLLPGVLIVYISSSDPPSRFPYQIINLLKQFL